MQDNQEKETKYAKSANRGQEKDLKNKNKKNGWQHRYSSHVFVVCWVGSSLCDELITRIEESSRVCMPMSSSNINDEATKARVGLLPHQKKKLNSSFRRVIYFHTFKIYVFSSQQ